MKEKTNKELKDRIKERIISLLLSQGVENMDSLVKYLESSDYFTAPASTKYHLSVEGGLAEHSLNVYELFKEKVQKYILPVPERTVVISSLLHDVCKVEQYVYKAYKTREGGTYSVDDKNPWGHGEKSVFRAMRHISLSDEEIVLMRWHMGEPRGFFEKLAFDKAREMYPSLTAFICSEMEASFILEPRSNRAKMVKKNE